MIDLLCDECGMCHREVPLPWAEDHLMKHGPDPEFVIQLVSDGLWWYRYVGA